jgi:hypothetical protein
MSLTGQTGGFEGAAAGGVNALFTRASMSWITSLQVPLSLGVTSGKQSYLSVGAVIAAEAAAARIASIFG